MSKQKSSYKIYSDAYDKQAIKMRQRGKEMYAPKYTKLQFETLFSEKEAQLRESIGRPVTRVDVINNMVDTQTYQMSHRQASAIASAANKLGIEVSGWQVRKMGAPNQLIVELNKRREELAGLGMASGAINKAVGIEFFGSPE